MGTTHSTLNADEHCFHFTPGTCCSLLSVGGTLFVDLRLRVYTTRDCVPVCIYFTPWKPSYHIKTPNGMPNTQSFFSLFSCTAMQDRAVEYRTEKGNYFLLTISRYRPTVTSCLLPFPTLPTSTQLPQKWRRTNVEIFQVPGYPGTRNPEQRRVPGYPVPGRQHGHARTERVWSGLQNLAGKSLCRGGDPKGLTNILPTGGAKKRNFAKQEWLSDNFGLRKKVRQSVTR